MKLGIVTYNIAAQWDCPTIISMCEKTGMEGVELRTTHAHKVETSLPKAERELVRKMFEDSKVALVGLGSTFEYHAKDSQELKRNIEGTKEYVILARDVGASGVKVRPNSFPEGVTKERTIEQIGRSLREVGAFAADYGIRIRLEVHGAGTCHPPYIKQMLDVADHPNVVACWNSNMQDLDEEKSIDGHFAMLKDKIEILHINEICNEYPWERLFHLLKKCRFDGFCLAEIAGSQDAERLLKFYRRLFDMYVKYA